MKSRAHGGGERKTGSRLSSLGRLSLRLGATLDLQTEASVLLDWVIEAGLAKAVVLFLTDEAKRNMDPVAWRGTVPVERVCIPLGEGFINEAARLFPSAFSSQAATISVPLVIEGELVGVLCAQRQLGVGLPAEESRLWDAISGLAVAILRNIQRHQHVEMMISQLEQRRQTEQLKDDLISGASHDLKSPVTSIKGYAQLAAKQLEKGDSARIGQSLAVIVKQADHLSKLLEALLDVSRIQAGRLELYCEEFDLVNLLDELVERFSGTTDCHRFRIEAPDEGVVGRWDRNKIEQTLANLVGNAIKYSPQGGDVVLRLDVRDGEVVVAIRDQGIGIAQKDLNRLFERFYRGQSALSRGLGGSGLGLYISQGVIQAHGGRIWVDSEEGKGSTFFVALPLGACDL